MAIQNLATDVQQTRDELTSEPDIQPIYKIKTESIKVETTEKVYTEVIGESWIVGSSTNGLVGTNTGTQGGGQQVVGGSGRTETLRRVQSPNNVFNERFQYSTFEDTDTTTADWNDGSSGLLEMTNTEIGQSLSIAYGIGTVYTATMRCEFSSGDSGDVTCYLSADGGSNFEEVTLDTEHTFTNTGTDLRFKIVASDTVDVSLVRISYNK